ncbi:MAG: hypothetical protein AAF573_16420 [Bacteroidota bacterium]
MRLEDFQKIANHATDTTLQSVKDTVVAVPDTTITAVVPIKIEDTPATKDEERSIFDAYFSWTDFILIAALLVGFYFLLQFLERILDRYKVFGRYQSSIKSFIHHTFLIYEALAYLILGGVFILIKPVFHGILALIVLVGGFAHVRNYLSGRIVHFDDAITTGKRIKTTDNQGIISQMGRLGLKVRTSKGLQFINYSKLVADGYTLLSGEQVGGFYQLNIQPKEENEKKNHTNRVLDLLNSSPYLDWNHKPQILPTKENAKAIKARVVVKEERHLHNLIQLIQEWGYHCKVVS